MDCHPANQCNACKKESDYMLDNNIPNDLTGVMGEPFCPICEHSKDNMHAASGMCGDCFETLCREYAENMTLDIPDPVEYDGTFCGTF